MEVLQIQSELDDMRALYLERKPKRVLEIGCWDGGTLCEWLAGKPELVVAVDPNHRNVDAYDGWRKKATKLEVVFGSSQDAAIMATIRRLGPYDWLFIDGDHDLKPVLSDTRLAIECAAPGALLLLHDIVHQENGGPAQAFAGAADLGSEHWTYVEDVEHRFGHGIGVVQL